MIPLKEIKHLGKIKEYKKSELVIAEGEKVDSLFIIIRGSVLFFTGDIKGSDAIAFDILSTDEIFGEEALTQDNRYRINAKALEDSSILEIPASILLNDTHLLKEIIPQIIQKKRCLYDRITNLRRESTKEQTLRTILHLANKGYSVTHPDGLIIKASRKLLAAILLKNRESIGRALKELEKDKVIAVNGMSILIYHQTMDDHKQSNPNVI